MKTAKDILESVIEETYRSSFELVIRNQDVFFAHRKKITDATKLLFEDLSTYTEEAWTPDTERKVLAKAKASKLDLVDHAIIGDYDLALWTMTFNSTLEYFVSINSGQKNPLDPDDQLQKTVPVEVPSYNQIRKTILRWLTDYNSLIIGSTVSKKTKTYFKIFRKWFPDKIIEPWYEGNLDYGFRISNKI